MKTTEYLINNSSEITLGKSIKVIGKVGTAAATIGAAWAAGSIQAVAGMILIAEEGSTTHTLLTTQNRVLYRKARVDAANAVTSFIRGQEASKKEVKVETDL